MISYLDSSVVIASLFNEQRQFLDWKKVKVAATSELLNIECQRVFDRLRLLGQINDEQLAELKFNYSRFISSIEQLTLDSRVLVRAAEAFPTIVGTLDAIHLSSALLWQKREKKRVSMLSLDTQLRTAATAVGLEVLP